MDLREFEDIIEYRFKNIDYLDLALTHSSYAHEHDLGHTGSNERLEFLGDAFLGVTIAKLLYSEFPDYPEGELTRIRALTVCEKTLAELASKLKICDYIKLGKGEKMSGGAYRASILSDAMEAVFAAIMIDGGDKVAEEFILKHLGPVAMSAEKGEIFMDYKTELQMLVQAKMRNVQIKYSVVDESGPDHCKVFESEVTINGEPCGRGKGNSKKEAEQAAAKAAIPSF